MIAHACNLNFIHFEMVSTPWDYTYSALCAALLCYGGIISMQYHFWISIGDENVGVIFSLLESIEYLGFILFQN